METLRHEIRHACRALLRNPIHSAAVVLTLVLGVGATTAVFSVVHGVLLQPLPYPESERLVQLWEVDQRPGTYEDHNRVSAANFLDWQRLNRVFEAMAPYTTAPVTFRGAGEPERVQAGLVGAGFFEVLGIEAAVGRTFLPEEDAAGADGVVVLSDAFWRARFGADPEIVGRLVRLGSSSVPIVGVLPADFRYLDQDLPIWAPLGWSARQRQDRRAHVVHVVARLLPGIDLAAAQADLERIVELLRLEFPDHLTGWSARVSPLAEQLLGEIRPALLVLSAAVGLVFAMAVVNVANLMLVRVAAEGREHAVRRALGAGRRRLLLARLIRSLILALLGGISAMLVAGLVTRLLLGLAPAGMPNADRVGMNPTVLGFAFLLTLAVGLLLGTLTAFPGARGQLSDGLSEGSRGSTAARRQGRLRSGFVVVQLAVSLVLSIAAGLTLEAFARLQRVDPGFDRGGLLTMKVSLPADAYPTPTEQAAFYGRLLGRLEATPGVQAAAVTKFLPLTDEEWTWSVYIEGRPVDESEKLDFGRHVVSRDAFRAMGIRVIAGRSFEHGDHAERPPVVVVNQAFVRRFFPDGTEPLGRRMSILGETDRLLEIVGVVEDVYHESLDKDPQPAYYTDIRQMPDAYMMSQMNVVLRSAQDVGTLVAPARRIVAEVDPAVPVSDVASIEDRLTRSVARPRFAMLLLAAFAAVALSLALVGIYGVVAHSVGERTREIGVRLAIGARPGRVLLQVLVSGARLALVGVGIGLPAAALFGRFQASQLHGVEAVDPPLYAALALLLGGVVLLASWLPARRASQVDPVTVLRSH